MKKSIFFLFLILVEVQMFAQNKVNVYGAVYGGKSERIKNANLSFITTEGRLEVVADSLGNYTVLVPKGNTIIEANVLGYVRNKIEKVLQEDTSLDFVLVNEGVELDEIKVLNETKKTFSILNGDKVSFDPQNFKQMASLSGNVDVVRLLKLMPGVQNSGDGNGYLYVRGGDPSHNLMLYADTPIYGMSHLLGIFPFYNADHIKEVQFDKSNSNVKYGGRLSSTFLAMPNEKIPKKVSICGNIGLLASQFTIMAPLSKKTSLAFSGRKTYIDEIVVPLVGNASKDKNGSKDNTKYSFADSNLTFVTNLSEVDKVSVNAFVSGDKFLVSNDALSLNADLKWNNAALAGSWKHVVSEKTQMKNTVYFSNYGNALTMNQASVNMKIDSRISDFGYSNVVQYFVKGLPFESGGTFSLLDVEPQNIRIDNTDGSDLNKQADEIKAINVSAFTSMKCQLAKNINTDMGLRFSYYKANSSNSTHFNVEPKIAVYFNLKENFSLFSTYARQNQYVNLITASTIGMPSDFWIAASDGIPSQYSNQFSLGGNKKISSICNAAVSVYYNSLKNLIEYPYGLTQFNDITTLKSDIIVGKGQSYGMEWLLKKEKGKLNGWLSYTLSWADRKFDEINDGEKFYAKYDRRHNISLAGVYNLNAKWCFGFSQIFSSGSRFTMPTSWYFVNNHPVNEYGAYNNGQLPNYIRTDFSVNYWLMKKDDKESILNLSVFNVFNVENPIYSVVNIIPKQQGSIIVKMDNKTLYRILPSISWRFKF